MGKVDFVPLLFSFKSFIFKFTCSTFRLSYFVGRQEGSHRSDVQQRQNCVPHTHGDVSYLGLVAGAQSVNKREYFCCFSLLVH